MAPRAPAALRPFHPIVRRWFTETLGTPSPPQEQGWPAIASGAHTLILAPTGTGKTLSAFLWELNALITDGLDTPLANAVHLLYISPLKALNNDIQRNLERPLAELRERFTAAGLEFPEIRVAVRTGDTPAAARARMTRRSPHILITTPESLHIMLTTVRGRGMFNAVRAVIVDEIHAVAGTKRGAHLALTLERLDHLVGRPVQRIGLSATQKPLEEIGRFLVGAREGPTIVDCGLVKKMEARVVSPVERLQDVGGSIWPRVVPLVLEQIRSARTTLVFVNNRAQAEKIAARLNKEADAEVALPYHGSLSRERRLLLEQRLKAGELRALVSTSSLELGIDIGSVDLVVQLQSPKRAASGLQRLGRAGHNLAAVSRGIFVPTFLDDAMELTAVVDAMRDGDVEPTRVVHNALDVLAQVVVAAVSVDDWTAGDLFDLVRRSYPYSSLGRAAFDEVLSMLAGKYPSELASELAQRITWDRVGDRLTGSNASRMTAVVSGGTIPDRGLYTVNLPDRTRLGELDEEFVHESRTGDVFQLGSSTWRIASIEHDRVIVIPAPGAPARMPFWHGEYMARSTHLTPRIGSLRRELVATDPDDVAAIDALAARHTIDHATAASLIEYVREQRAATGIVPDDRTIVVEHFRDDVGAIRVVIHAPFGGRVNAPWGMALAGRVMSGEWRRGANGEGRGARDERREERGDLNPHLASRTSPLAFRISSLDVQVQTSDDGIMLRLPDLGVLPPVERMLEMSPREAEDRVLAEVGESSLFGARFRMNAARALLLPRGNPRRRMPLWLQRLKALDLLQTVREFPSFPILVETYRDVLQDAFDMPALAAMLGSLERGEIRVHTVALDRPSPFSASLLFGFKIDWLYVDDTPRAEQQAALLSIDRALLDDVMGTEGADDATLESLAALLAIRRGTAPRTRARNADELAILLDRAGDLAMEELRERVALPEEGLRGDPLTELLESGRAIGIDIPTSSGPERRIILTETFPRYLAAFGAAHLGGAADLVPEALRHATLTTGAARRELLARWLALAGPVSVEEIRRRYAFGAEWIGRRLGERQRAGKLVHGYFGDRTTQRWVPRRLLEHARRRALAIARRQVEAVPLATFVAFLQRWQHLDERDRLEGARGTAIAVGQLVGLPRPADAWERDYLPARVRAYDTDALARLTSSGEMVWVGGGTIDQRTGVRTLTSIRFVDRGGAAEWIGGADAGAAATEVSLTANASRVAATLESLGASFIADIQRTTGLGPLALHDALRELAAAGLVTNDTAAALREVARTRSLGHRASDAPDPTRWLPDDFTPSANRPVIQRRPNLRRMPRWRRPDLPGPADGWGGRWALVRTPSILGAGRTEEEMAESVARQWLDRYGIVSREWWRRERPAVSWRAIYRELKTLELRGDVRRGYFVRGLSGAQFALPQAVEQLRAAETTDDSAPVIVMAASDPANAYAVVAAQENAEDPAPPRPRGRGALLVTRAGRVVLSVEGRGRSITVAPNVDDETVSAAAAALARHLLTPGVGRRVRDIVVETIDGRPAALTHHAAAFQLASYRSDGRALRVLAPVR
jgi:ATP-dependent helicase Lhr and Lhr-like helicase